MSRKRRDGESLEDYHRNLREERKAVDNHLKGRVVGGMVKNAARKMRLNTLAVGSRQGNKGAKVEGQIKLTEKQNTESTPKRNEVIETTNENREKEDVT